MKWHEMIYCKPANADALADDSEKAQTGTKCRPAAKLIGHDQMDQGAQRYGGGAFGQPRFCFVVPGRAGDVQVDPRSVASELTDKPRAGDAAAPFAAANILNVGKAAFDELAIFIVHRHLPHFFAGSFGGGEKFVGKGLIAAEDPHVYIG